MPHRLLSFVIAIMVASAVWGFDDWPQFRGPNRNGLSTEKGLLDRWDEAPPLVWKAEGLGIGYSGVAVSRGIACTMGDRNGKNTVICLSDKDGKEIWATEIDKAWKDNKGWPGSRCTPTIDGERIYAVSPFGHLVCLKTATGELVWEKFYQKHFEVHQHGFGFSESVLVDGDKLVCAPGGEGVMVKGKHKQGDAGIVTLNKYTGAEIWRCKMTPAGTCHSSIVISNACGVKQYVQVMNMGLIGVHAETGKLLWRYDRGFLSQSNIVIPLVRDDYVFVGIGWGTGGASLVKVERDGEGFKAREVYHIPPSKLSIRNGAAVLVGDHVYTCHQTNGSPRCLELLTGKMTWENRRGPGRGQAAIMYADGHLYYRYHDGVVALIAANPDKYQLKGTFQIPGARAEGYAHPSISNGRLYLRERDALFCYDIKKK